MCDVWKQWSNKMSCEHQESPPSVINLKTLLTTEMMLSAIYCYFTPTTLIFVANFKLPWICTDRRKLNFCFLLKIVLFRCSRKKKPKMTISVFMSACPSVLSPVFRPRKSWLPPQGLREKWCYGGVTKMYRHNLFWVNTVQRSQTLYMRTYLHSCLL
jgi:hypothetical protein